MSNIVHIPFSEDREVRAVWDETNSKWRFSVPDVIGAIRKEDDYTKCRNYWKYLKNKLKKEGNQLVSDTTQLKMTASDGKKYLTDTLDMEGVINLATVMPGNEGAKFIQWLTRSDDTTDGKSKQKAYLLYESSFISEIETGTTKGLQQIHSYLFGGLYDFAGQIRILNISKGGFMFANSLFLPETLKKIDSMPEDTLENIVSKYIEMNVAHPFMEGNGRSTRIWLDLMLKKNLNVCVDWSKIDKRQYLDAMKLSPLDGSQNYGHIRSALTEKKADREIFMKGIDYSYYYEESD